MKMQTFRKPHQWLSFWLEKYVEVLTGLKFDGEKRKKYWSVLKTFLEELPGNPRNLSLPLIKTFISTNPGERLIPITLFYQHIAPSPTHLEMLNSWGSSGTAETHTETQPDNGLVKQFEVHLSTQNLSERTIKNYLNALNSYLKWLEDSGTPPSIDKSDDYRVFLTEIRQLAPRTIVMQDTALKLFYTTVAKVDMRDTAP